MECQMPMLTLLVIAHLSSHTDIEKIDEKEYHRGNLGILSVLASHFLCVCARDLAMRQSIAEGYCETSVKLALCSTATRTSHIQPLCQTLSQSNKWT
eukprot:1277604-Amphidinium_carterae.1